MIHRYFESSRAGNDSEGSHSFTTTSSRIIHSQLLYNRSYLYAHVAMKQRSRDNDLSARTPILLGGHSGGASLYRHSVRDGESGIKRGDL
jgi:hypothetical protein